MKNQIRNVFVSHIHEDDHHLTGLKDLAKENGLKLSDSSITSDNPNNAHSPDYIKKGILAPAIRRPGTLVVYISRGTRASTWVDWEIRHAHSHNKRIVGIWGRGVAECELPKALREYADSVVVWDGSCIVDAIQGKINIWMDPHGKPWGPTCIRRSSC